jgi:hypothetical protein
MTTPIVPVLLRGSDGKNSTARGYLYGAIRRLWGLARFFVSVAGQDAVELVAGADVELGEDLVQVVFDGARAHKQLVARVISARPGRATAARRGPRCACPPRSAPLPPRC